MGLEQSSSTSPHRVELLGAPQGVQKRAPQEWRASTHECAMEFLSFVYGQDNLNFSEG